MDRPGQCTDSSDGSYLGAPRPSGSEWVDFHAWSGDSNLGYVFDYSLTLTDENALVVVWCIPNQVCTHSAQTKKKCQKKCSDQTLCKAYVWKQSYSTCFIYGGGVVAGKNIVGSWQFGKGFKDARCYLEKNAGIKSLTIYYSELLVIK